MVMGSYAGLGFTIRGDKDAIILGKYIKTLFITLII